MLGNENLGSRCQHCHHKSDAGADNGRELRSKVSSQEVVRDHKRAGRHQAEGDHFDDTLHPSARRIEHYQSHNQQDRYDEARKPQIKDRFVRDFRCELIQRDSELLGHSAGKIRHVGQHRGAYRSKGNRRAVGDQRDCAGCHGRESQSYQKRGCQRCRRAVTGRAFNESSEHIRDDDRLNAGIRRDLLKSFVDDLHDAGLLERVEQQDRAAYDQQQIQRLERAVDKICQDRRHFHLPDRDCQYDRHDQRDDQGLAR